MKKISKNLQQRCVDDLTQAMFTFAECGLYKKGFSFSFLFKSDKDKKYRRMLVVAKEAGV
jgi:hypothetical protein